MAAALIPESALSAIVGKLVNTASSYVQQDEASGGMAGEVAGLQQALPKMELILMALEGTQIADRHKEVETWLWRLRDAVEDAEDVLDELDYYELEKKIQARDRHKVSVPVSRRKRKYVDFVERIFSDDTLKSLKEAVKELNKVAAGMQRIIQIVTDSYGGSRFTLQSRYHVTKARESRSCLIENVVLGRDKERDRIVEWLTKQVDHQQPSSSDIINIPTFAIVGESRAGKTALAQLIHCDERVRGYFDMVRWVTVSEGLSSGSDRVISKILESVTNQRSTQVRDLKALHWKLKSKLISKRFLLILDDIEPTSAREWNKLIFPLKYSRRGSKILLTTENTSREAILRTRIGSQTEVLNLNDLEESDYMMLFNKHAYPCVDPDEHEDLKLIGKQITSKLRGMPSAVRVVGRVLSSRMDYGYWERILNHIMNLEQSEGDLTVLSEWDHLPTHLQMCFRYCSLFPQGYMFEKDKLISMWMASGLIQQPMHEKKRPEDIGADYLNILSRKSFFNRKLRGPGENFVYYYFTHDLLYELAQNTSSGECLQIKGVGQKNIPSTLRHLTLESATPLEIRMISHLKHLRTLIVSYTDFCNPEGDHVCALNEVLKGLKSLRLFSLNVYIFRKLPDPIGSLIHLRYLSLRQQCSNKNLLDFVSHPVYGPSLRRVLDWFAQSAHRLYHLEVMETSEFSEVNFDKTELDGLDNLINLRHLYFPSDITIRIPWIGKLTSLQELNDFNVREESGYRITELKDLKELRQLYVGNLQNASHEEAIEAKLNTKTNLKSLTLEWSVGRSTVSETDELFLDNLQPYCNLTELKLGGYNGASFSNWINSAFLPNLKSVVLFNCHKLENLPPLVQLNSLHFLHLNSMRAVKTICLSMSGSNDSFLQLRELRFECMPEWVEWVQVEDRFSFPELQILEIKDCPRLRRLPTLPPYLRRLSITNAGLDDFPRIHSFAIPKEVGLSSPHSSITNAGLDDFPRIHSFAIPKEVGLSSPHSSITNAGLDDFPRIHSFADPKEVGLSSPPVAHPFRISDDSSITYAGLDDFPRIHSFADPKEVGLSSPPVAHPFRISDDSSITYVGLDDFPRLRYSSGVFRDGFHLFRSGQLWQEVQGQLQKEVQGQLQQKIEKHRQKIEKRPQETEKQSFQSFDHQERSYHGKHQFKQYNLSQMTQMIQGNIVLPRLERLAIGRCGQFDVSVLGSLSSLTSLSRLRMDGCVNVSFLPSARVFERLTALRSLEILNCKNLESLGGIQALRSLRFLSICGCGKLTADSSLHPPTVIDVNQWDTTAGSSLNLDELEIDHHLLLLVEPLKSLVSAKRLVVTNASSLACLPENWLLRNRTSLQDITMYDAVCLHSLPPSMASFCSLQTLKLFHAPLIESLPILPTSLTTLCITDCHPLLKARCQEDIGLDWRKIANIPHVSILKRFHADDN